MKSRLASLKQLVQPVSSAQEIYYLAQGDYADRLSDLDINIPAPISMEYIGDHNTERAIYPWGICYLQSHASNCLFQCNNMQVNIGYIQRFLHCKRPGTRACTALYNDETSIAVCKQETNNTTPYYQGDNGYGNTVESYLYQ